MEHTVILFGEAVGVGVVRSLFSNANAALRRKLIMATHLTSPVSCL